jgi:hypothetical protein
MKMYKVVLSNPTIIEIEVEKTTKQNAIVRIGDKQHKWEKLNGNYQKIRHSKEEIKKEFISFAVERIEHMKTWIDEEIQNIKIMESL